MYKFYLLHTLGYFVGYRPKVTHCRHLHNCSTNNTSYRYIMCRSVDHFRLSRLFNADVDAVFVRWNRLELDSIVETSVV
jgi:hypothetical protein